MLFFFEPTDALISACAKKCFFPSNMTVHGHMIKHAANVCLSVFMHELTFTFPPNP